MRTCRRYSKRTTTTVSCLLTGSALPDRDLALAGPRRPCAAGKHRKSILSCRPLQRPKGYRPRGSAKRHPIPRFPGNSRSDSQTGPQICQLRFRLVRTRGPRTAGDENHDRISVLPVVAFSQQRLTSFARYESAWRTANTGSNSLCQGRCGIPPVSSLSGLRKAP